MRRLGPWVGLILGVAACAHTGGSGSSVDGPDSAIEGDPFLREAGSPRTAPEKSPAEGGTRTERPDEPAGTSSAEGVELDSSEETEDPILRRPGTDTAEPPPDGAEPGDGADESLDAEAVREDPIVSAAEPETRSAESSGKKRKKEKKEKAKAKKDDPPR